MIVNPTQSNVQAALAAFLTAILPGLPGSAPAVFTGTIAGTTLTVTKLPAIAPAGIQGIILANAPLLGLGVVPGTTIIEQLTGTVTGGIGTYQISISQMLSQPVTMSTGVAIIAGQQNRTPEPANPYFGVMTPIRFDRLETNVDTAADVRFTGSIAANQMTVTDVTIGEIQIGATVFGLGVLNGTTIISQVSGTQGEAGVYTVSPGQTVPIETLSAGAKTMMQPAKVTVQLDFHSPDSMAGDFSQTVSTAFRDEFGVTFFENESPNYGDITPLYADDPRQTPFINDQNEYEWRWSLDACLQANQIVDVPQTYADSAVVTPISVDASFPP